MSDDEETSSFDMTGNIWEQFLQQAQRNDSGGAIPTSTLFVVGDPQNGKSSVLKNWKDRVQVEEGQPEYIIDYSYCNVIDRYDPDTADDALVSRMSIWQLDDDAHASILHTLTNDRDRAGFVITLDLSEPWNILKTLDKWLEVYKKTCEGLITGGSDQEKELKLKISKYIQTWVDTTKKEEKPIINIVHQEYVPEDDKGDEGVAKGGDEGDAKEEKGSDEGDAKESDEGDKEEEKKADEGDEGDKEEEIEDEVEMEFEAPIDPDIPVNNYGIPLFVVGLKADYFEKGLNTTIGADDKFEFLTTQLRKRCLEWGATLIYTSAIGEEGINVDTFADQVYHRLLGFPLNHPPKVVGSHTDFAIHVPSGFDNETLIELGGSSKWDASTHLSVVFDYKEPGEEKKSGAPTTAKSDIDFFRSCKEQLDSGVSRVDRHVSKSANKKKKEKAVKSFFKSLLSKE